MFFSQEKLDGFVLNLEFLLISVVQGVALSFLATAAIAPLTNLSYMYWIYIFSGFLFILLFWSQSIIHALSFIDWPLNLSHSFLYFLVSFFEVIAFTDVTNPLKWFIFVFLFFLAAGLLYIVDFAMIRVREKKFLKTQEHKALYHHVYSQQRRELYFLVPAGLSYNILCILAIWLFPNIFIAHNYHVILGFFQAVFTVMLLIISIYNFSKRAKLISDCVEK